MYPGCHSPNNLKNCIFYYYMQVYYCLTKLVDNFKYYIKHLSFHQSVSNSITESKFCAITRYCQFLLEHLSSLFSISCFCITRDKFYSYFLLIFEQLPFSLLPIIDANQMGLVFFALYKTISKNGGATKYTQYTRSIC